MILSDLLGCAVYGEDWVGWVTDVRFVLDEISTDQAMPPARLRTRATGRCTA